MKKLLIANRGEIALRIIRAAKELGIKTVAVHSQADVHSMHVRFADEDVCIGPPKSRDSYLNQERVLSAAIITNADAIHPGYGFLAENAEFAEKCHAAGITFVGPTPEMIHKFGNKAVAKDTMKAAGVPCIPGNEGVVKSAEEAVAIGRDFRYPVIIKAVAGGGGKGMRIVREESEMKAQFEMASAEAGNSFGNPEVYIEKYIENPRHIEVQLLGDEHGHVVHLFERDCSIQRRHQKLIEESPSPAITPEIREKLCATAVRGAQSIGYKSAGTMEFLLDTDGSFYFMEMNTRIQVEHPVSEMITGLDLVKEQIAVAMGNPLPFKQSDIKMNGHAIECRINAEDPDNDFRPSPGTIKTLYTPGGPGVRIDKHVYAGYVIPPYYDSMIAKLICHGRNRDEAASRMRRALDEFIVEGVKTTIPLHKKILNTHEFRSGHFSTRFLEDVKL
ncbi:MAG: acetyl-CoA carboxylase biotin carboxylase subunit [Fibrobacterota bacterium]